MTSSSTPIASDRPLTEYDERCRTVETLRTLTIDPYPATTGRTHTVGAVTADFDALAAAATPVTVAGRLRSLRLHGNIAFADVEDADGRLQLFVAKGEVGPEAYTLWKKTVDASDFVATTGVLFVTKAGEKSLRVTSWRILTKTLRALPTDHYGLADTQERYRKRYVDLALSPELRARFVRRARFWTVMRAFLEERGFLAVETPTLEVTTGGAEARPFATHHNDFDLSVYLRISVGELWQKRLMAAGFERTYEIGRAYRNEGTSPNHLQEFTNMEFYWAYADHEDGMALVQDLYRTLARDVYGTTIFVAHGQTFDLAAPWPRIDYVAEIRRQTGLDVFAADASEISAKLAALNIHHDAHTRERLIDNLWKYCRKSIAGPAFLVGHPAFLAPLAKRLPEDATRAAQFQILLAGAEVGKGYSELNDPEDQRMRFEAQQRLLERGDDEAMMPDWDFVEMLEYGMPPACGFGVGERLFAFMEGVSLRDATLFPLMRPRGE